MHSRNSVTKGQTADGCECRNECMNVYDCMFECEMRHTYCKALAASQQRALYMMLFLCFTW